MMYNVPMIENPIPMELNLLMDEVLPRKTLEARLDLIEKIVVERPMYGKEYQVLFQQQFLEFGIEVTLHPYDDIGINQLTANGFFCSWAYEEEEETDIELVIVLNNLDRAISINNTDWDFFRHQVTQTLEHEMIHRDQARARLGSGYMQAYTQHMDEEQKRIAYLSDPDEIDAYANDVALDMLYLYSYMTAYARMRNYKRIRQDESPIFCEYVDTFGWNSETVHILVKKALKRLET